MNPFTVNSGGAVVPEPTSPLALFDFGSSPSNDVGIFQCPSSASTSTTPNSIDLSGNPHSTSTPPPSAVITDGRYYNSSGASTLCSVPSGALNLFENTPSESPRPISPSSQHVSTLTLAASSPDDTSHFATPNHSTVISQPSSTGRRTLACSELKTPSSQQPLPPSVSSHDSQMSTSASLHSQQTQPTSLMFPMSAPLMLKRRASDSFLSNGGRIVLDQDARDRDDQKFRDWLEHLGMSPMIMEFFL